MKLFLTLFTLCTLAIASNEKRGETIVTEELQGKKKVLRVRITGDAAEKICALLGIDLSKQSPGYIVALPALKKTSPNQAKSCLKSDAGAVFGFLIDKDQATYDLESSGYK